MPRVRDLAEIRAEKWLASALRALRWALPEVEAWGNQALADDLHQVAEQLRRIHEEVLRNGRRYRAQSTSVRISDTLR